MKAPRSNRIREAVKASCKLIAILERSSNRQTLRFQVDLRLTRATLFKQSVRRSREQLKALTYCGQVTFRLNSLSDDSQISAVKDKHVRHRYPVYSIVVLDPHRSSLVQYQTDLAIRLRLDALCRLH